MIEELEQRTLLSGGPTVYTVDSTTATGTGSGNSGDLVYVINQANANMNPAGSLIEFDPAVFGASTDQKIILSATLELSEPDGPETIDGPGAGVEIGCNPSAGDNRIFQVDAGVTATVSGVTLSGDVTAYGYASGGAIANAGALTVAGCTLTDLSAADYGNGGGIDNSGTLTVTGCTLTDDDGVDGGAIYNTGTLTVTGSALTDDEAGFGLSGGGGGIDNAGGALVITDCTLAADEAPSGGGIESTGQLTSVNCTIADNTTYQAASGGGLSVGGGTATLDNTIVASNTNNTSDGQSGPPDDIVGTLSASSAYNLIGTGGSGGLQNGVDGNLVGIAGPGLAPPGNYGGPTETIALRPSSPAIDAGSVALANDADGKPLLYDQRGAGYPRTVNGSVDIGAYEHPPATGPATVYTVDLTGASGAGSGDSGDLVYVLKQADADTNPNGTEITFDPAVFSASSPQTIKLTTTLGIDPSPLAGPLNIDGPGASAVTISGQQHFTVFQVGEYVSASLSGLTISDGIGGTVDSQGGGGIDNAGTLTVTGCTISGNYVGEAEYGGPEGGGGIYNASSGTVTITGSTITGNRSILGLGGGIYNLGAMTIADSAVSDNVYGGIDNAGEMIIASSTISGTGRGDGISTKGALSMNNSTIADNEVGSGSGIYANGALSLVNCTISGNTSTDDGTGSAGLDIAGGTAILDNTIVAGNTTANIVDGGISGYAASDIEGAVSPSSADNLIGAGGSGGIQDGKNGNLVLAGDVDPMLGGLADYGGPTETIALLPGSPAIGAGSIALAVDPVTMQPLTTDQRGAGFPRTTGGAIDIGAYERLDVTAPPTVYTVDLMSASGAGSGDSGDLVYAVQQADANTNPAGSMIDFDPAIFNASTPRTIDLSSTLELSEIDGPLAIDGPGANAVTISGQKSFTVIKVDANVFASLAGLTISGGDYGGPGSDIGGGVENAGYLTVASSAISDNEGISGGGIWNTGHLTLTDSSVTNNGGGFGGGIDNSGAVTAVNTTFALNSAEEGAIYSDSLSYIPYDGLRLTLTNCTIADNQGAGLVVDGGTVTLNNTIVALNTEAVLGVARASDIFVDTSSATMSPSSANNLIGTGGSGGLQNGVNGNLVGVADPGLGSLADNGGPTPTIALLPGSPAIGAGSVALAIDPTTGQPLTTDQRGPGFARVVYDEVDIGAFQSQSVSDAAPRITAAKILDAGKGGHAHVVGVELFFSEPLEASRARDSANYDVIEAEDRRGKTVAERIKLKVRYKRDSEEVILMLVGRPAFAQGGQLIVNAKSPKGLLSSTGDYLSGGAIDQVGGDPAFVILPGGRGLSG